ncbi:MAG: recombination protein RecR [Clostridia bacterium]|nr:recombination protein RecR [Clostridia bacterium]
MAEYIAPIKRLIEEFRKLPGVGAKTAVRYAFATLSLNESEIEQFADAIIGAKRDIRVCPVCCGLTASEGKCEICSDENRDSSVICVVESAKDIMVMEKVRSYRGMYHVLGGVLSPIDNISSDDLNIKELVARIEEGAVKEVIVATNPTPSGDTTAAYIARILEPYGTEVSRLAYGIPVGGDIEYADEITLYRAMEGRKYYGN